MNRRVRVRFAPSPTGPLHIGGLRTALYNYLFAKHHQGDFLLRIEDTDQTRFVEGAEDYIYEALEWCNILPNESPKIGGKFAPYKQSDRKTIYADYAKMLIDNGKAYYAFDSAEELENQRKSFEKQGKTFIYNQLTRNELCNSLTLSPQEVEYRLLNGDDYVIRLKVDSQDDIIFQDMIRGEVKVNAIQVDDKVLLKSDGMPTYHLANVVDDYLMEISHVIRGEEWLPSTPLHILLYRAYGWEEKMPQFAHLPLLLKPFGKGKLSKRDGDQLGFPVFPLNWKDPQTGETANGFREAGYLPDAFLNFLALQGWNPGTEQEIFSIEELIKLFTLEKVQKSGARFDINKAIWFNQQYLKTKNPNSLILDLKNSYLQVFDNEEMKEDKLLKAFVIMRERISFVKEVFTKGQFLFEPPKDYDAKTVEKKLTTSVHAVLTELSELWKNSEVWAAENLEMQFKSLVESKNEKLGNVMPCLRVALTGESSGPGIFDICVFLGKNETLARILRFSGTFKV